MATRMTEPDRARDAPPQREGERVRAGRLPRRKRLREATRAEIVTVARRLLVESGPGAVSLRAIARDMGVTAPALYRYYASHEQLLTALIAGLYDELTAALESARDTLPADDVAGRLGATSLAFRRWALTNRAEFGLLFGAPMAGYDAPAGGPTERADSRFGAVFLDLFTQLWQRRPYPVRADDELDPVLVAELRSWLPSDNPMPLGAVEVFLRCWIRLYGAVAMEAFGHLRFATTDARPLFERELDGLTELLGGA
jgi:AcrR family transcriptional regulator